MPPLGTVKPPQAGPGGEGSTGKAVDSHGGWNQMLKTLNHHVPRELANARLARRGLRQLQRKAH